MAVSYERGTPAVGGGSAWAVGVKGAGDGGGAARGVEVGSDHLMSEGFWEKKDEEARLLGEVCALKPSLAGRGDAQRVHYYTIVCRTRMYVCMYVYVCVCVYIYI